MSRIVSRWLLMGIFLASCAPKPILYPNQHYKDAGRDAADQTIEECRPGGQGRGSDPKPGKNRASRREHGRGWSSGVSGWCGWRSSRRTCWRRSHGWSRQWRDGGFSSRAVQAVASQPGVQGVRATMFERAWLRPSRVGVGERIIWPILR